MKKRFRLFIIRQGLIKPKTLAESREAFPFPADVHSNHVNGIGIARSIEPMHYIHKR